MILNTENRRLPCKLNDEELKAAGTELAQACKNIDLEEEIQATQKATMKSRLATLEDKRTELADKVSTQTEYREVDVQVELLDNGTVQEVRTDTGEVIAQRLPKPEERQKRF